MSKGEVIILLAEGFEEIEALGTVDVLRRLKVPVRTAGLTGIQVTGAHGIICHADTTLDEAADDDFAAVVLPGGLPGATNLLASEAVRKVLQKTAAAGGVTAAICAAPIVLAAAGLLKGRRFTMYPGFDSYLNGAVPTTALVEVDGSVITGKGPGATCLFAARIAEVLGVAPEAVDAVLSGMFVK